MMNLRMTLAAGLCSLLGTMGAASAADAIYPGANTVGYESPSGWTFTFSMYGWLSGIEGDVGAGGRTAHIDASIDDILSNLDIAVMGLAEARYERFGIFTDLNYVKLSTSSDTPFGILANSLDFTTHSLMWTAAGEYRLIDQRDASLDAFVGFRLFSIKNELDFNPPGLLGGVELSQTETWADPIVGLKGRVSINQQFYLTGWALIGGGASSDLVWDVMGGAGYQFNERVSAVAGYRAAGVDYKNDGFVYDVVQQGPILGVTFRF
ncbi:hypothetical protein ELH53_11605 [Rhizobium ruizarguesonis]|uniref:hypothetical protein n=1 Tax=Rhizobium ruizarguesonis TaxID=2081791 RepID=UPI0003664C70|nr:hypothetical protein [Rhizobium ruizarguesonis]MBY5834341.1 hypothetical protein [Rhizobium leguminosarum]QJS27939.1 hypothetical protein RLTA1_11865 [Rhizobium leguminosarum bv. trifolii TA1]MBY5858143.1 hypothetical protein [Rhizobium leguminosarum]MBY5876839.1 hypothetical protein [Rhizobium leguminosarum]NEH66813.1 hypothetical protein [Rhizobium ruizarguesonis]